MFLTLEPEPRDSARMAQEQSAQRAMDAIAEYLENCGCVETGGNTTNIISTAALSLGLFFIGWQIKRLADKTEGDDVHNEGDVNVEVIVPPNDDSSEEHYGENKCASLFIRI